MLNTSLIALIIGLVYSIALPVGLMLWWKKKTGEKLWCFVAGALCFLLFAMGLEQILHSVCLVGENPVSAFLTASPVAYTLYAALAAGLFEETGRLFGFKVLLKQQREKACPVAYGIGHGGIEVFLVLGVTYLMVLLAKAGVFLGDAETTATMAQAADSILPGTACIAMFERLSALMAHIGLSMLVFLAARQKGKGWLYPVAILLHALLDTSAALYQFGVIRSLWIVEGSAFVLGLAYLLLGSRLLHGYTGEAEPAGEADAAEVPE